MRFADRHRTLASLLDNSRFYILAGTMALSVLVFCLLRLQIAEQTLFYMRVEQVFGALALVYWYGALIITPVHKLLGQQVWLDRLEFARRGIGVSAAYFAALHIGFSIWGQLGGVEALGLLPVWFRWSFLLGAIGFVVLAAMAVTSFDRAIRWLTFPRWKLIHRFGYAAGLLVLTHVWLIGTHVQEAAFAWTAYAMLALLVGLEALRFSRFVAHKYADYAIQPILLAVILWAVICGGIFWTAQALPNYHNRSHNAHQ